MTTTARPLSSGDPKRINMTVQSENERNKAVAAALTPVPDAIPEK
jgi:hypothetical protein